jgi:hypothetical protein
VDPAIHIVDCATEAGQSLWLRRGPSGDIVAQRALLDAPIAIFDEYQAADRAVRRAITPFLSGRRHIPVENSQVDLKAVPMLIMNPRAGGALAARTGLSVPQLRRLIPCDVSAVDHGDLARRGEQAVEAARLAGPISLRAPRGSCESFRGALVRLLSTVLTPDAVGTVDVDLLLGLGTGLTAWLPEASAMRQALYDALFVMETVGWVQAGWVDAVRQFSVAGAQDTPASAPRDPSSGSHIADGRIVLFPERHRSSRDGEELTVSPHDSLLPPFTLSDATKARLIWLSQELPVSLDQGVNVLIDHFATARMQDSDYFDLDAIVRIRKQCKATEVSVSDLRAFLEATATLGEHNLTIADVGPALETAEALATAGLTLLEAAGVARLMADLQAAGVETTIVEELRITLARYEALGFGPAVITPVAGLVERLGMLGITPEILHERVQHLERLAAALSAAGLSDERRDQALAGMVEVGLTEADLDGLRARKAELEQENQKLAADLARSQRTLSTLQDAIAQASKIKTELSQNVTALRTLLRQWGLGA